jgi:hypothetical protein
MAPRRAAVQVVLVVGALVGLWHLWLAAEAIFVFRNGEPWWSWAAVLFGPGLTLVAVVIAMFRLGVGGIVLLVGGGLSLGALTAGDAPQYSAVVPFLIRIALPMAVLGGALLALSHSNRRLLPTTRSPNGA